MAVLEQSVRTELENQFGIEKIQYLASGDDSDTFLCDDQYVVKIPKRDSARKSQLREFQLYAFLKKQKLSFQIPEVIYQGYRYNIMSYIQGHKLTYQQYHALSESEKDAIARDEAAFLRELHSLQVNQSEPFYHASLQDKGAQYEKDRSELLLILEEEKLITQRLQMMIHDLYARIFQTDILFDYIPCLTHNDFSADNMVFANNRLLGVIDFGDFLIGDPDNDFLCILDCSTDDFGKEFGRRVLYYYGHKSPEIAETKAEINDAYWPVQQILLGYARNDRQMLEKGYHKLFDSRKDGIKI